MHALGTPLAPQAGLLAPLAAGAAVILPAAGRFAASTFWKDAVEHGATFYTGTPRLLPLLRGLLLLCSAAAAAA